MELNVKNVVRDGVAGQEEASFSPVCVGVEMAEGTRTDFGTKVCRFY